MARRIICQIIAKFDLKLVAKVHVFVVFLWGFFAFRTLVFGDFHIKNYGHYFNILASCCSILVNPKLTSFDVKTTSNLQ